MPPKHLWWKGRLPAALVFREYALTAADVIQLTQAGALSVAFAQTDRGIQALLECLDPSAVAEITEERLAAVAEERLKE